MPVSPAYRPSMRHASLGYAFYDPVKPAAFPHHRLRFRNDRAAAQVGLETLGDEEWVRHFGYFDPLPGSLQEPLALRYHGHQFQHYNPDLGDGRGFLFAQLLDVRDGRLLDLGTKGSGTTPWSRSGDGRLTLKGGVREILATEMLEALGVNTSRSFSLIETGERLYRNDEPSPTRSSVLVRLNHSHIRIGTFQRLASLGDRASLAQLIEYAIETYFPAINAEETGDNVLAFFEAVCRNVARTGAQWSAAGFVHGVLNTDNINITGESFDYGPWRFMPFYNPLFTAAYFDRGGLYSYGNQPEALAWNLGRLAECLVDFTTQSGLQQVIDRFGLFFQEEMSRAFLARLGLVSKNPVMDRKIVDESIDFLFRSKMPFESFLFDWYGGRHSQTRALNGANAAFYAASDFEKLRSLFDEYESLIPAHDYFRRDRPCTMLIDQVEAIWEPIAHDDDWSGFHAALDEISIMRAAYRSGGAA